MLSEDLERRRGILSWLGLRVVGLDDTWELVCLYGRNWSYGKAEGLGDAGGKVWKCGVGVVV